MADELEEEDFKGRIDLRVWRRLLPFLRPHRWVMAALLVQAVGGAAIDVAIPLLAKRVIDTVTTGGRLDFWSHVLPYAGLFVVLAVLIFLFILLAGRITTEVSADVRTALFDKLQQLQFAFYDRRAVGWLMARMTSDANNLSRVFAWGLLDLTWGSTLIVGLGVTMFVLNWRLALAVCAVGPVLAAFTSWLQRRQLAAQRQMKKTSSLITAAYNEAITGVRTTKSMVREEANLAEFRGLTDRLYGHAVRSLTYSAVLIPTVAFVCSVGVALGLWRGGADVVAGTLSLGTLFVFLQYTIFVAGPAQELAVTLTMIQGAQASAERITGLLDEPVTIKDSDAVRERVASHAAKPTSGLDVAEDGLPDRIGTIEFRGVSFGYDPARPVLHDFDLTVRAGETVALVGATGGGKSTIVSLVCRFYEPTAGSILIDGVDYRERPLRWLQSKLGMVLQQPHLFSGTVRENIRYGRLTATDTEVEAAARLTNAHDFIARLPAGYDSPVGEGGASLSTGQKQLVALARAVIADPQIFVMDEATSSVDTGTERAIQQAVERVLAGRIAFVIAHRLSTIRRADQILVIDGGRVVERGRHDELIRRRGRYHALYTSQFTHEREEAVLSGADPL